MSTTKRTPVLILLLFIFLPCALFSQDFIWDTTFTVNQHRFEFSEKHFSPTHSFLEVKKDGVTQFLDSMDYTGPSGGREFIDFNEDGYVDLKITWIGQVAYSRLYLFDQINNYFKFVDDLKPYLSATILEDDKDFYFSYSRAGCADRDWVSHLFKIVDFKTVRVASIIGVGCPANNEPEEIRIRKYLPDGTFTLIETIPYDTIDSYPDYKWGFIKKYWNTNVGRFK